MASSTLAQRQAFYAAIVSTALEGGIGYWAACEEYKWYDPDHGAWGGTATPGPENTANAYAVIVPNTDDPEADWEVDGKPRATITIDTVTRGVGKVVRGEHPLRSDLEEAIKLAYREWDAGQIGADEADCIVQIGLFGEVVYG